MRNLGEKVLNEECERRGIEERRFRFGFHLPPVNSVNHLHLHCFIEPLTAWRYNRVLYGWLMNSVDDVLAKL